MVGGGLGACLGFTDGKTGRWWVRGFPEGTSMCMVGTAQRKECGLLTSRMGLVPCIPTQRGFREEVSVLSLCMQAAWGV